FTQGRSNLFYSRTIGLNPDRGMVPILGGAKLTQKSGSYRIGLMTMLTEEMDGVPLASHSVLRVRKDVLDQSYIGFIATNLSDDSGHNNQLYGGDFSYNTDKFLQDKNLEVQGSVAGTITDGEKENNLSSRIALRFSSDLIYLYNVYQFTDEKFNQEMGYIYRTGVRNNYGYWRITPRPNLPFIKKFVIQPIQYEFFTDMRGKLLTRHLKFEPLGFIFNSNDELHFLISNQYEYLEEDYNIFEDVMIPSGGYEWWYYELKFQGNKRRPISFNMGTQYRDGAMTGDYYNGTKAAVRGECIFKVNQYYAFSADIGYSDVSVGSHRFKAQEYSGRVIIDFSTRLSSKTFVQWNNETNEININFRLHYIPKIGSDVYVVYNHLFDEANNYSSLYNTGVFKVDYTNRF
ncbi:MAG: hypothetical protein HOC71_07665, partial [Candidatus Latescibacteria bacterium]|nr:hypothetical protein [Candidatus Latescibacterota bacterium]